ncbi:MULTISPECIES: hypothetical protein [Nocardiopsis]|uniref:Uncharacterized protein n=1 Tax=Nocardiopsis sinuspersici TaxID=501010 RepID=A0A1V3C3U4_9ACTN|nr:MULTISPECIES: hypothetical protein [Nocardiopsis]NYH51870.1 hypothetical protein [Nocardiopsis sinuspersici]OOC55447.1 hypothetical protein NOSIN_17855 [Nocardiopsis sinuspersici]
MNASDPPRPERSRGARGPRPARGERTVLAGARTALAGILAALVLAATACTAPPLNADAYLHDARQTTVDLLSAARTGILVAELAEDDRAFQPYLEVSAKDVEESARSLTDTFGALQPPTPELDGLRDELTDLSDATVHDLSALRIALRRGNADGVVEASEKLHETASALVDLRKELR